MNISMIGFWWHNVPEKPVVFALFLFLLISRTCISVYLETKAQENTLALSYPEMRLWFSLWMGSLTTME